MERACLVVGREMGTIGWPRWESCVRVCFQVARMGGVSSARLYSWERGVSGVLWGYLSGGGTYQRYTYP